MTTPKMISHANVTMPVIMPAEKRGEFEELVEWVLATNEVSAAKKWNLPESARLRAPG